MQRVLVGITVGAVLAAPLTVLGLTTATTAAAAPLSPQQEQARLAAPVIMTGAQFPSWSRLAAQGLAQPYPSGASQNGTGLRSAHNGTLAVPPDARSGVDPNRIAAYRWSGSAWSEVPVQIDQRFPYFLANGRSTFSFYSGTDEELTYAWGGDAHSRGDESWKNVYGECTSRKAQSTAEALTKIGQGIDLGPGESPGSLLTSMADPVPTLDDDDEIVVMARDAGLEAGSTVPAPLGTSTTDKGQAVRIVDPLDPTASKFVYLFQKEGGSSFNADTSMVQMKRDDNADEWVDRYSFAAGPGVKDPETLGTSNTGYGANLVGSVCRTAQPNDANPVIGTPDGVARDSKDRFPRDGMTVSTPTYKASASGRWMVRGHQVAEPGQPYAYGPDLVSRWKGRAFQQSPDSSVSLVGFEDEQVNWEANASQLGWRQGPLRAIREVWGADSGTNVTKTETYYREADTYAYQVRVHPIPSDGLYTSWAYNPGAVTKYYNLVRGQDQPPGSAPVPLGGVDIDGINDDTGSVDKVPGSNQPAYFDAPDPTFDAVTAVNRPEEVAGPHGGLVYEFEFTQATSATNAAAVPYYRDDDCLDDGTGDAPLPRPYPGEKSTDSRVQAGYLAYWQAYWDDHPEVQTAAPRPTAYADLHCATTKEDAAAATPPWKRTPFTAAFGQHGIHFFTTQDSDNAFGPKPVTQIVGQQWRFSVPMSAPTNVVKEYGNNVSAKLQAFSAPYGQSPASASPTPSPTASATTSPSASASGSPTPTASGSPTATAAASTSPTATASATATATASTTASPSAQPTQACPSPASNLPVRVNTPVINATGLASVTVTGARPQASIELQGYSQDHHGSVSFANDMTPVDRTGTADANGTITFSDLRPASNTRVRAHETACAYSSAATGQVINVRATETLRVVRNGPNSYTFGGESIPARPGGLIVSLFQVVGESCAAGTRPADCPGERFVTQARAQGEGSPGAGSYRIDVQFPDSDRNTRRLFVVKTGQDAQNAPGRSNTRSLLIY